MIQKMYELKLQKKWVILIANDINFYQAAEILHILHLNTKFDILISDKFYTHKQTCFIISSSQVWILEPCPSSVPTIYFKIFHPFNDF